MRTKQVSIYTFDELSDAAKETARDRCREGIEADDIANYDDWQSVAAILGIEFDTGGGTRRVPSIYWSASCRQGDGASFEGVYRYAKGASAKIRRYAPEDTELHRIADTLQAAQKARFYSLRAHISRGYLSNFYRHSGTMSVDVFDARDDYRDIGEAEAVIQDEMRAFADWIYGQVLAQTKYLNSDESVEESIHANEYEFYEAGSCA